MSVFLSVAAVLAAPDFAKSVEQDLASAANYPTASLMSFQLQDCYDSDYHNLDNATRNTLQFRAAIPFSLGGANNVARITLPYLTDTPSVSSGLSETTPFNLTVADQTCGRWEVGAEALLPTGEDGLSVEKKGGRTRNRVHCRTCMGA